MCKVKTLLSGSMRGMEKALTKMFLTLEKTVFNFLQNLTFEKKFLKLLDFSAKWPFLSLSMRNDVENAFYCVKKALLLSGGLISLKI